MSQAIRNWAIVLPPPDEIIIVDSVVIVTHPQRATHILQLEREGRREVGTLLRFGSVGLGPEVETVDLSFSARLETSPGKTHTQQIVMELVRWEHRWTIPLEGVLY